MSQAQLSDADASANDVYALISRVVLSFTLIHTFLTFGWMVFEGRWILHNDIDAYLACGWLALISIFICYPFVPLLVALAGIAALVKEFIIKNRRLTLIINSAHLVTVTLVHFLFVESVQLLLKLIE